MLHQPCVHCAPFPGLMAVILNSPVFTQSSAVEARML